MTTETLRSFYAEIRRHHGNPLCCECGRLLWNYPDDTQSSPIGRQCWACFIASWELDSLEKEKPSMAKSNARSHTHFSTFNNCMRLYGERYYYKRLPFVETPQTKEGNYVHQQLNLRLSATAMRYELPPALLPLEPVCQSFQNAGVVHAELALAVNKDFVACDYNAAEGFYRGKIDVTVMKPTPTAYIGDWKTGNPGFEDPNQVRGLALLLMARFPHLERVAGGNLWTRNMGTSQVMGTVRTYDRATDFAKIATDIAQESDTISRAESAQVFPPMPGPFCSGCEVLSCEHRREKRAA